MPTPRFDHYYRYTELSDLLLGLAAAHPELMVRGARILPWQQLSYTLIPLSVGMFPHIFMHWLSARRVETFRLSMIAYPICIAIVWLPSVTLGVLGHNVFEGLQGPQASSILIRVIEHVAPDVLAGLLGAGVFAAVMSSLDSQTLAIGTMFTQDVVRHYGFRDRMGEKQQVLAGRLFVIAILALSWVLSLVTRPTIFGLAVWSFSGFAALLPLAIAAVFWKRATRLGAYAAVLSVAISWTWFFIATGDVPGYTVGGTGIMPVAVMFVLSSVVLVAVSLVTPPPSPQTIERFFGSR